MFNDTSTSISRSGVRQSPNSQFVHNSSQIPSIREAIVVKTGPAENFECSVFVYCFHTKEILKVSAGLGAAASRGGVGDFEPYFPGDRVIVTYLYGDSNKGCITGRTFQTQGLSEELLNGRLPQPGTVSPSGEQINPNPTPVVNNSALYGGFASIKTRPLII